MEKLGEAADGLFIWASTTIKYIGGEDLNQFKYLKNLVEDSKTVSKNLNELYATVFRGAINWKDPGKRERFSNIFSLILFGKTLLSANDIDSILGLNEEETRVLLSRFRSVVTYEEGGPIRINHTSLYDYLIECKKEDWYIDEGMERNKIALRCFGLMKSQLRFNICDLETSFKFNRDVPNLEKRVNERVHPGLLYACRQWASHLRDVPYSSKILSELDNFMYKQLLYWIEVLSLTGCLYGCFEPVLESAIGWAKKNERHVPSELLSFLEDALHHIFEFIQPISESTPHLYMTFLPFKKSESNVARHYSKNMKEFTCIEYIGDRVEAAARCTKKIDIRSSVSSFSLSFHSPSISFFEMCFWDVDSGELIEDPFVRDTHVSPFSGNTIVVTNRDGAVNEWGTDICERTHGLSIVDIRHITSVLDNSSRYYAIGFEDGAIQLWKHGEWTAVFEPLKGHSGKVLALVTDRYGGGYLASGSEDQTIIIWNPERREMKLPPLKGHSGPITSLVSMNLNRLSSGSLDGTVRLWDVSTGDILHTFSASEMGSVYSVACYDYRHILSGSEDGIIRMWDTEHREMPPKKFVGHTDKVISLAMDYSNRGRRFASGSSDGTVCVWDIEREPEIVGGPMKAMAVSPNGEYLVSGSGCATVSVWRIGTGKLINGPLEGHTSWVTSLSFSPDGLRFASGSEDGTVRIWNLDGESVTCLHEEQEFSSPTNVCVCVCFSPDGKYVASGSGNIIRVFDSKTGKQVLKPLECHSKLVISICYSPDGNRIVSGSRDENVCIWDALNGTLLQTLPGQATSVKYSHDGSYIISVSVPEDVDEDETIRFLDANNGKPVREPIKIRGHFFSTVYVSPDDTHFVLKFWDNCHVRNTSTEEPLFEVNVVSPGGSLVFLPSSDSKYIKFASSSNEDGLIRIYCVDIDSKGMISDAPNTDGWLIRNDGNLVSWIPSDIRHTLIYGSCVGIINSRLSTKLTLSKYQGSQWTSCFPSSGIV